MIEPEATPEDTVAYETVEAEESDEVEEITEAEESVEAEETEESENAEGFTVLIGEDVQPFVTDFLAQQEMDRRMVYPHWEGTPTRVIPGRRGWTLKLTQLLPEGAGEPEKGAEPFSLTVSRGTNRQVYRGCCWQSFSSRQKAEGTEIVRSAYALDREVTTDGQDAV